MTADVAVDPTPLAVRPRPRDPACRRPPLPSTLASFSLVARDLRASAARSPCSTASTCRSVPAPVSASSGPTASARRRCCGVLAGQEPPDRGSVTATPPSLRVGYLAAGARAAATRRCSRSSPGAPASPPPRRSSSAPRPRSADRRADDAADAYADALDALPRGRRPRPRRARPRGVRRPRSAGATCSTCRRARSRAGRRRARRWPRSCSAASTCSCSTSRPTTSTSPGSPGSRRSSTTLPGGVVVVSHDRAFLERTVTRVLELDEHTRSATEYGGGWLGYLDARATARRHAEEDYADVPRRDARGSSNGRARSASGRCRARARRSATRRRSDKFIRHFKVATSEKQAAKARATEQGDRSARRGREAVGGLGSPLPGGERAAQRRRRRRGCATRSSQRGSFRSGRSTSRSAGASGSRSSARTARQDHAAARAARAAPARAGERWIGPGVVVGEMDQARDAFAVDDVAARRVHRRDRARSSPTRARCWPSSGSAPST